MATEQMDYIRRQYNRTAPRELKRSKTVFFMRVDRFSDDGKAICDDWLVEYSALTQTYELKGDFFHIYDFPTRSTAEKSLLD